MKSTMDEVIDLPGTGKVRGGDITTEMARKATEIYNRNAATASANAATLDALANRSTGRPA